MLKTLTIAELINFKTYLRETTLAILRYCSQKEMLLYWLGSGKRLSGDR